jgi:hypothetical protein
VTHAHLVADSVVRIILSRASVSALCIAANGVRKTTRLDSSASLREGVNRGPSGTFTAREPPRDWSQPSGVMLGWRLSRRFRSATHLSWAPATGQQLSPCDLIVGASELLARLRHPDFELQR